MKLELAPITLKKANDFVAEHHRHCKRTFRNGGKFAISARVNGELVGVAIVGNPLSATFMEMYTAEVSRVCVSEQAPKNTNSFLYGACWRAWRAMGGRRLITYTLRSESGGSLRGAGWRIVAQTKPIRGGWNKNDHLNYRRRHQKVSELVKNRWEKHK